MVDSCFSPAFALSRTPFLFFSSLLPDENETAESKEKLETYEEAMRRIRDATGATDVGEVVQRFLTQGETQEHLQALQRENTEKLSNLREVSCDSSIIALFFYLLSFPSHTTFPTNLTRFPNPSHHCLLSAHEFFRSTPVCSSALKL